MKIRELINSSRFRIITLVALCLFFTFTFLALNRNTVSADFKKINTSKSPDETNLFQTPTYLFSIGNVGNKLNQPMGVTTDPEGNIYVADSGNHEIKVFSSEGKFLYSFGKKGTKNALLKYPYGLVFIDQQKLLVADTADKSVKIFDKKGKYLGEFFKERDVKPGLLYKDSSYNIYVIDMNGNRILVFDLEGKRKKSIKSLEFSFLQGVVKDSKDNLIIANSGQNNIMFLNQRGQLLKEFYGKSDKYPEFSMIRGIAIDNLNRLIVSDTMINKIRFFDLNGSELFDISSAGSRVDELYFPTTIHTTDDGKIFIVDRGNNRVVIWTTGKEEVVEQR